MPKLIHTLNLFFLLAAFIALPFISSGSSQEATNYPEITANLTEEEKWAVMQQIFHMRTLAQDMKYLDEVLTTSVLSYAFTQDDKWLARYNEHEPKLAEIFNEVLSHGQQSDAVVVEKINSANAELVALETKAINLVKNGKGQQALNILNSDNYRAQKTQYAQALSAYFLTLEETFQKGPVSAKAPKVSIQLSEEEKNWLAKHPVIKMGVDTAYPPFEYVDSEGEYRGIILDYFTLIGERLGIKFKPLVELTWTQALDGIKGETIDILSGLNDTQERRKFMNFTRPYLKFPIIFITRNSSPPIGRHAELSGKIMAFPEGYSDIKEIKAKFPSIKILEVKNMLEALTAIATGKADATQGNLAVLSYLIQNNYLTNLKVAGNASIEKSSLAIGVRRDWPELASILDKTLASITREEHQAIRSNWIAIADTKTEQISFTDAEKKWIEGHPTISVAATPNWPPFEWQDEESGTYKGITADFMRLAAQKAGLKLAPEFGAWSPLVEKLKAKQIDVAPGLNKTPEREKFLLFSEVFTEYFSVIFSNDTNKPVKKMSELNGETVAIEKGYALAEVLAKDHPKIKLKLVENSLEALQLLSAKKVEAYVGNQLVGAYLVKKYLIPNIKTAGFYDKIPGRLRFGIRDDWPILKSILDKALATITDKERNRIIKTYTGIDTRMGKTVSLSDKEREWISQHRTIRLGVNSSWPPFEYVNDEGAYSGLASGYVEILAERLDLIMTPQPSMTWSEAINALEKSEGIDVLPAVTNTEERHKFMNFTKPYLSFPLVIATRIDSEYVGDLEDVYEKRVGVVGNYYAEFVINRDHPDIKLVQASTVGEGLKMLQDGKISAFVDNLGVITHEKDRLGIEEIKIAAPTEYKAELSIGVRKDWPELIPILNKALDTIDAKERSAIQNSWLAVQVKFGLDTRTILTWAIPIGGSAVLVIFVIVIWNRKMGAEIEQRKIAEGKIASKESQLRAAVDNMLSGILMFDKEGKIALFNQQYMEIFDFPEGLLSVGGSVEASVRHQANRGDFGEGDVEELVEWAMTTLTGGEPRTYERHLSGKNVVEINIAPTPDGGTVAVYSDITERKQSENRLQDAYEVISSSINYATNIQHSTLPPSSSIEEVTREHFVLWEPRDRVGGDIYWCKPWGLGRILALGDCTGHGVPGAFMTLIANGALEMAIMETMPGDVSALLQRTHQIIQESLGQKDADGTSDDGLELGICYITPGSKTLTFAGARFSLFHNTGSEIIEFKGDKTGIGYRGVSYDVAFTDRQFEFEDGNSFYMTSDGLIDQVGGEKQRGFGKRRFRNLLLELGATPMSQRGTSILAALNDYQGNQKRRDDVSVIGFTI